MKKVVVVGGGFSGMVTAYYLSRAGFSVDLHEAGNRLGGLLGSERTSSGLIETAANGFILNDDLVELLQDLKLEYIQPFSSAKRRYIFRKRFRRWPLGILETIALTIKVLPKLLFNKKSLRPRERETIWSWGKRCLTRATTKYLVAPALQGIYAGDSHRMSAELIFGPMFQRKPSKYRGTVSFKNGMGEFIIALEKKLREQGVNIHLESYYKIEDLQTPHVVCVSAATASKQIEHVALEASQKLARIETLPVLSATVFFERPRFQIKGFGALFPEDQSFRVLGVLSNTHIFENRGPLYSETWIFGGTHSPEVVTQSNDEVLKLIQTERLRFYGLPDKIVEYRLHPWPKALPHYTVEHQQILQELKLPSNLYLNGNYLGVIGLSKILSRSKELVHVIS